MPEVIITIGKDGIPRVEVQGVAGPSCRDLTAALEAALGEAASVELTADYYQEAQGDQLEERL